MIKILKKPSRGEVWFVDLDPIKGHEQAKKRPCIVISNDMFNQGASSLTICVPLTSKRKNNPFHVYIPSVQSKLVKDSYAMCDQIRVLSLNRFESKPVAQVDSSILKQIEYLIKVLLDFE